MCTTRSEACLQTSGDPENTTDAGEDKDPKQKQTVVWYFLQRADLYEGETKRYWQSGSKHRQAVRRADPKNMQYHNPRPEDQPLHQLEDTTSREELQGSG